MQSHLLLLKRKSSCVCVTLSVCMCVCHTHVGVKRIRLQNSGSYYATSSDSFKGNCSVNKNLGSCCFLSVGVLSLSMLSQRFLLQKKETRVNTNR